MESSLAHWAITLGAKSFGLGVIEDNYKGKKFWSGIGYKKINEETMDFSKITYILNIMTYHICA